jgi:hypothetical protein
MKNLKVFDLKNNPLECNDDFKNLMKFLGLKKVSEMSNQFNETPSINQSIHFRSLSATTETMQNLTK